MTNYLSRISGFAALAAFALTASAAEQDIITKSISTKPGQKLTMVVDRGEIEIRTHSADSVEVKVLRELSKTTAAKARDTFSKHTVEITGDSDGVRIKSEMPKLGLTGWFNSANRLSVHYTVTVPEKYNLDLSTSGGDIHIGAIEGQAQCRTSGGDIELGAIRGPVNARTSGGDIELAGSTGPSDLHTSGGDIEAVNVTGNLKVRTSGGGINLSKIAGEVNANTSGGDIRIADVSGPVSAHTSGGTVSAQLAESPKGQSSFKTSGGNVNVTLPANAAVDVAAKTSGGDVGSDFPGEYNKERNRYSAKLNGGGPAMVLETSGGNIHVRRR